MLLCVVLGFFILIIKWMKNEEVFDIESFERLVLLVGGSLEISDVIEDDVGIYFCIVDNGNEIIEV